MNRCLEPTCPTLVRSGSRCPEHQRATRGGTRWDRWAASKAVLDRDGHACVHCGAPCPHPKHHQVDHIRRLADGGSDGPSNKQTLCVGCHRAKTRRESGAMAR